MVEFWSKSFQNFLLTSIQSQPKENKFTKQRNSHHKWTRSLRHYSELNRLYQSSKEKELLIEKRERKIPEKNIEISLKFFMTYKKKVSRWKTCIINLIYIFLNSFFLLHFSNVSNVTLVLVSALEIYLKI